MIFKEIRFILLVIIALSLNSCGLYSLSGVTIPDNIKTFQVDYFGYQAVLVEPGLERDFTLALQDLINDQSRLSLTPRNGDYIYQGEITRFYIAPMTATADSRAAQNRVTLEVNLRFTNTKDEEESFEKKYSFFYDYDANAQLQGSTLETAKEVLFEQITQDIFNDTLAKW
ncbi:LPS assembly lipoprotein LptE [Nonlabens dokdonensis]|mgnify:CR=1 FL=1|uniref:LPS assembly lipoprotein LptE n=1 Tax=Nonlabens dokdonensis TaxID=328515 RepID=UPI0026A287D8|nr:LPS assembly lipoprotein LptE [Nonlabens dokdonensis]